MINLSVFFLSIQSWNTDEIRISYRLDAADNSYPDALITCFKGMPDGRKKEERDWVSERMRDYVEREIEIKS